EPLGVLALLVLVGLTPSGTARFWWTLAALLLLASTHLTYWFVTHPVNSVWTKNVELSGISAAFFSLFASEVTGDWSQLRNIWECSHVARAILSMLSLVALTIGLTT
ncbi:MAG: DUF1772 domain-containing protein, partial [Hyphomicrobiaceae bacterium]